MGSAVEQRRARQRDYWRYRLLFRLEEIMEPVMFVLAFVWLWFFVQELTEGLSRSQQLAVTAIWIAFIGEFLLKLYLAPARLRYITENWITLVALAIPAMRAFRMLRALRILRLARVTSTTRIVRALTSTRRAYRALRTAQGAQPEPKMNVGVLVALSRDSGLEDVPERLDRICADVALEISAASQLEWSFQPAVITTLESGDPRRPADFLDEASMLTVEGPYDLVIVATDVPLVSRKRQLAAGLVSRVCRVGVISLRPLLSEPRDHSNAGLEPEALRFNAGTLLLHLLGRIGGLSRGPHGTSEIMQPFVTRPSRRSLPRFNAKERKRLARVAARLPERELRGANPPSVLVFHVLMAFQHPRNLIRALIRNRALLLPLSLPGLATAAVAPTLVLVFSAETWDVGLGMSNATAGLYAGASVLAASFYLAWAQSLFLPRHSRAVMTEHLAVANSAIFLSILLACIGLFLMVGILMLLIQTYIFPADLIRTWPTLSQPDFTFADTLRLASFISTIGVTTGALAGGLESRTIIRHLALFEDN